VTSERRFLEADWRNLVMLNYIVDPDALADRVPAGCELDFWSGRTFVSVVGFQFLRTRVLNVSIPFHRDFEEVNLRFYVRRRADGAWRRGVVFVKELVPRFATAFVARRLYGEPYEAMPMRHSHCVDGDRMTTSYQWRRGGVWERMSATVSGPPVSLEDGSEEWFISEHHWGYSQPRDRTTEEYRVDHPRWRVWRSGSGTLECDVAALYGRSFVDALSGAPSSAFVAEGSPVVVMKGERLKPSPAA